jgi:hypothetical protein
MNRYPGTYAEAEAYLGQKLGRPIANNTRIVRGDGHIALTLHENTIVEYTPSGVSLYSSGWRTPTTKDRINRVIEQRGYTVFSVAGVWYVAPNRREAAVPFAEGLTLRADGTLTGAAEAEDAKRSLTLRKSIKAYAKAYAAEFGAGRIDRPGPGDCVYCRLEASGTEAIPNDHLEIHLADGYYVPSLLVTAARTCPDKLSSYASGFIEEWAATEDIGGTAQRQIESCIKAYLIRRLG